MARLDQKTTVRFSQEDVEIIKKLEEKFGTKNTSDLMRLLIRRLNESLSSPDK